MLGRKRKQILCSCQKYHKIAVSFRPFRTYRFGKWIYILDECIYASFGLRVNEIHFFDNYIVTLVKPVFIQIVTT